MSARGHGMGNELPKHEAKVILSSCVYNGTFYWTVITQQCGAMFILCN